MTTTLSIIIPTHRRVPQVVRLLKSIEAQAGVEALQILVVSNFRDERLAKELLSFQSSLAPQLLVASRSGVNASRNLGWDHAQGSILLFLDDDCELHKPDYLQRVLQSHRENPETLVIGGGYDSDENSTVEEQAYNLISNTWCESHQYILERNWALLGGNISYKSSLSDYGQRFNEDILYGGSETEFHVRLFELGIRMKYLPHLNVLHRPQVTTGQIFKKALKQALTSDEFQLPRQLRAANLGKYLYTQKSAQIAQTKTDFQKYLEVFRLHEDAFLKRSEYTNYLNRSKRLLAFHWKSRV